MKLSDSPFSIVFERVDETKKVNPIPIKTIQATTKVEIKLETTPSNLKKAPLKNIVAIVIRSGNLPLQGTKLLVRIAINLSRGELIILHPITPAALQPKPMHMVVTIW